MFLPKYFVVPMPIDKEGRGPARAEDTVRTEYEVWDEDLLAKSSWPTEAEAMAEAARLNSQQLESN